MKTILRPFLRYLFSGGIVYRVNILLFMALQLWLQQPISYANAGIVNTGHINFRSSQSTRLGLTGHLYRLAF